MANSIGKTNQDDNGKPGTNNTVSDRKAKKMKNYLSWKLGVWLRNAKPAG